MGARLGTCALLLAATPTWAAQPPQINVIRAEGADPIILEITNRTRAELTAAGLDATIVDCFQADTRCTGVVGATDGMPHAVVMTARDGEGTMTEVTVVTALQDVSPLVLRMAVGAESADHDDPATLAVRAAELVQSALWQAGVTLRQELAAAQASLRFRVGGRVRPRMAMGCGIYHLAARGVTYPGSSFEGRSVAIWAPVVTAGGGAALMVGDKLDLFFDVEAVFVPDHPELLVGWTQIGGGNPSLLLSTGVERLF